jgi:hypothetical protein
VKRLSARGAARKLGFDPDDADNVPEVPEARWNRPGIPHRGWAEIGIVDLGAGGPYSLCEMCRAREIRYAYRMIHPDFSGVFEVGAGCAKKMAIPRADRGEKDAARLRAAVARAKWAAEWRPDAFGDPVLRRNDGAREALVQRRRDGLFEVVFRWLGFRRGLPLVVLSGKARPFPDPETAKAAARHYIESSRIPF